MFRYSFFFLLFIFVTGFLKVNQTFSETKQTTIEAIKDNPKNFEGDDVEFTGLVIQYVHDIGSTNYYLIKGDFGGIIRVNTAEPAPETNVKYNVKGIVYIDRKKKDVFISERIKTPIEFPEPYLSISPNTINENESTTISWNSESAKKVTLNGEMVSNKGSKNITGKNSVTYTLQALYPNGKYKEKTASLTVVSITNPLYYVFIVALVLLIGAFIYFQLRRSRLEREPALQPDFQEPFINPREPRHDEYKEAKPEYSTENDYKTIKITKNSPKTLKFIPGKFVIISSKDKGKEFRIAGYPTSNGFIVTIGRKEVSGDRAYAHIQLNEMTVSREQAELHYSNNKIYIKNLSETNLTQLNGRELAAGETSELAPESVIKTGEVEFRYIV